jgi:hypothetical protein
VVQGHEVPHHLEACYSDRHDHANAYKNHFSHSPVENDIDDAVFDPELNCEKKGTNPKSESVVTKLWVKWGGVLYVPELNQ